MHDLCAVAIQKTDVLMEDFSNIQRLIHYCASTMKKLIEARNTWEVFFDEYDDDPREIPEIPEVVNWVEQSVEAGIPWFYFMRGTPDSLGLRVFMTICGAELDPETPGRYVFDRDRLLYFIKKNLTNLEDFSEKYNIPDEVSCAATDEILAYIQAVISGKSNQPQDNSEEERKKMYHEALERLTALETMYGLNPKVKAYFKEGKLYYSYLTCGGYMGSIDTINYDERYADIVKTFEKQTSCLVYHVIEHNNTLSLLFVSSDYTNWLEERPTKAGVPAQVITVDDCESTYGYIKLDVLQGALRRLNNIVYPSLPDHSGQFSRVDSEVIERIEILKTAGLFSDLNPADLYTAEREMCFSELHSILGTEVCVVNRLSANPTYQLYAEALSSQVPLTLYFLMVSTDNRLAFLFVSDDEEAWTMEKQALENGRPHAIVVDMEEMTASVQRIRYQMVNGGPVCLL